MNARKLTPLWRDPLSLSWSAFPRLWNDWPSASSSFSPPYDIVAKGDNSYVVSVDVAGFQREDLEISTRGDVLRISAKVEETPEKPESEDRSRYLYRGLVRRSFDLSFSLAQEMEVSGAELKDGILHITLKSQAPEEPEKRVVEIAAG